MRQSDSESVKWVSLIETFVKTAEMNKRGG